MSTENLLTKSPDPTGGVFGPIAWVGQREGKERHTEACITTTTIPQG